MKSGSAAHITWAGIHHARRFSHGHGIKQYSSACRPSADAHGYHEGPFGFVRNVSKSVLQILGRDLGSFKKANPPLISVDHKNVPNVRLGNSHLRAEQSTVRFPEPSRDLPSHVHLYERKLL